MTFTGLPEHWTDNNVVTVCGKSIVRGEMVYSFGRGLVTCPGCLAWLAEHPTIGKITVVEPESTVVPEILDSLAEPVPVFEELQQTPPAPPPPPKALDEWALLRLAAVQPGDETYLSMADAEHLQGQRRAYQEYSKEDLIDELIARDTSAIKRGREVGDGRTAGRLLREFTRAILYTADAADLRESQAMLAKGESINKVLELLGAEKTPLRDLRVNGGTLLGKIGPISAANQDPEEAIQHPTGQARQWPSEKTAEGIRNREK